MIQGECKLCLQERMLCDSHLAPAGLYRFCKAKELGPVRMTAAEISEANEEVTAYLLCEQCEALLNRDGENWLLPKLATIDKTFPFYDILTEVPPDTSEDGTEAYTCSRNPKVGFRKLTNFVVGVFWKSSVHSWGQSKLGPLIELGKYRELFRQFLLHKGGFPERAALVIGVTPPDKAVIGFNIPMLRGRQPYHSYLFYIPGMIFALQIGNRVTAYEKESCFFSNPLHPIVVSDLSDYIYRFVGRRVAKAKRSPHVLRYITTKRAR